MKKLLCVLLTLAMLVPMMTIHAADLPFGDVPEGEWYEEYVAYCYETGLMKGVSGDAFNPAGIVTREQFVQTLANLEGVDLSKYEQDIKDNNMFCDVLELEWYAGAIEWARQEGIVAGVSADKFGLGQPVTREQMATMLGRYASVKGQKTNYSVDLGLFGDKDSIHDWAVPGVSYAVSIGLFKGDENSNFKPLGNATRAELATVLMRANKRTESRILCWGDSLTMGIETGWDNFVEVPYPERLGEYLGVESVNLGIGSETSDMIAMRQGGIPVYVDYLTIPADCTPVEIAPMVEGSDEVSSFGLYGFEGINDVEIAGVKGKITDEDGGNGSRWNTTVYFTRNEPGEEVKITERTRIITKYMVDKKEDDILVIWVGSNDLYGASDTSLFETIVANQQAIIDYAGTDEFIIVGYTANTYLGNDSYRECTDVYNELMKEQWGDKFLDVKEYLATYEALEDHGIEPTPLDNEMLAKGWIPASFLEDSTNLIHFNQLGYDIVADMISAKIVELGYLN